MSGRPCATAMARNSRGLLWASELLRPLAWPQCFWGVICATEAVGFGGRSVLWGVKWVVGRGPLL